MTTRMLINATVANELRIAIVEDGELIELDIETADQNQLKGNIYKGVVHNVEQSLAACFVDIGGHKQGFLPFGDIAPSVYSRKWNQGESPRITDVIKRGQEIVVQVQKDAIGEKGATLTTYLSLPGRFTVLLPGSDANGVSRKIDDETARKKIRAVASKIEKPEDCGFIVRTSGLGQTRAAIQKDLNNVIAIYEKVNKSAAIARAPSLLYAEPDLVARTLRDFFNEDIDEVWIDSREEYETARRYFEDLMPSEAERIHWYQNPIPIFAYHHVEEQIEATFHRTVALPSGGSIVIDETEALVAIDVNSGKMTSEKDHEDTVFKTNLEAAEVAAQQLKLRDLGGIVVIDFIDMELRKNEQAVEKALLEVSKQDKARYKISKINAQGLCVLTRQRIRQGMRRAFQRRCQTCVGTGWIRTPESHSLSLLRRVETRLAQGGVGEVRVSTHRETAEYLLNMKRAELMALEREHRCRILVAAKSEMDRNADDVVFLSKGEMLAEITDRLPPREERRLDRSSKRKRIKKRRAAELEGPANGEPRGEGGEGERLERSGKRRRRSRRDRGSEMGLQSGEANGHDLRLAASNDSEAPAPNGSDSGERPSANRGAHKGATFTGRPPPEVLARLKAERRARMMNQRPGRAAQPIGTAAMDVTSSPPSPAPPSSEPSSNGVEIRPPSEISAIPETLETPMLEAIEVDYATEGPPEPFEAPVSAVARAEREFEAAAVSTFGHRESEPAVEPKAHQMPLAVREDGEVAPLVDGAAAPATGGLAEPRKPGLLERLRGAGRPPLGPPPDGDA